MLFGVYANSLGRRKAAVQIKENREMLVMTVKELVNKKWVTHPDPMRTSDRVAFAKTFIGKPAIVAIPILKLTNKITNYSHT